MLFIFVSYSGTPIVTMIIARDARAYMNSFTHMRSGDVITYIYVNQIESHTDNFKIFPE